MNGLYFNSMLCCKILHNLRHDSELRGQRRKPLLSGDTSCTAEHLFSFFFPFFSNTTKSKPEIFDICLQVSDLELRTLVPMHKKITDTPAPSQPGSKPLSASAIPFLDSFCACLFKIKPTDTFLFLLSPLATLIWIFLSSLRCSHLPALPGTSLPAAPSIIHCYLCSWISPSLQASCSTTEPFAHTSPWFPRLSAFTVYSEQAAQKARIKA